jgi:hypothetical protein
MVRVDELLKLTVVVALYALYGAPELGGHKGKEV